MSESTLVVESTCCRTMMNIVGHGNSVLAEIQRLGESIPQPFFLDPQGYEKEEYENYCRIIFDFSYQTNREKYDEIIQKSARLLEVDEAFKTAYFSTIERFFIVMQNIVRYYDNIIKFLKDLNEGVVFVDQSLEKLFKSKLGKQILCEMVYLYGVMLLIIEKKIPGIIRERILMSYFRYCKVSEIDKSEFLRICKICSRAELETKKGSNKFVMPADYPCEYFNRVSFPTEFIDLVISKLRSDDVYNMTSYYPFHEHRTIALSQQASILYVMLFFKPSLLKDNSNDSKSSQSSQSSQSSLSLSSGSEMRQIVDNLFCDNWVISYYMGFVVDLSTDWERVVFKSARQAINNVVSVNLAKNLTLKHSKECQECIKELEIVLRDGAITEEYVLDNIEILLKLMRRANMCLRWLVLHRASENKKLRMVIEENSSAEEILHLLLNVAQFEFILTEMFKKLLEEKQTNWTKTKEEAKNRMRELSKYYSGAVLSETVSTKDEQLQEWFNYMEKKIDEISYSDSIKAGNKLHEIIQALKEVEEFKNVYGSLQVKQFLMETRDLMKKMIRITVVQEDVLLSISILSDISYGWRIIHSFIPLMQHLIINSPSLIIKMRSTFLKLSTVMEAPCVRIKDAPALQSDLASVSAFYSRKLVEFVRKVLEIIPKSVFGIVRESISPNTEKLQTLPVRFDRDDMVSIAQSELRDILSLATFKIAEYTAGVLAMRKTLIGIIQVDPRVLLEDGVRAELVIRIVTTLEGMIKFDNLSIPLPTQKGTVKLSKGMESLMRFEVVLGNLARKLSGMRRSFEYIQDYILVYGLKLWHEELSRIIMYYTEMECNKFLKNKVQDWQSRFQSKVIPIPQINLSNNNNLNNNNFMGRLVSQLLNQTEPSFFHYFDRLSAWLEVETGQECFGLKHIMLLEKSVGVSGLLGVDQILSFGIVKNLKKLFSILEDTLDKGKSSELVLSYRESLSPLTNINNSQNNTQKSYFLIIQKMSKLLDMFSEVMVTVGRSQLIKRLINQVLNFTSKLNANLVHESVKNVNKAILNEIREKEDKGDLEVVSEMHSEITPLSSRMETIIQQTGLDVPLHKVFLTIKPICHLGFCASLMLISQAQRYAWDQTYGSYVRLKKKDPIDIYALTAGIITFTHQISVDERAVFFSSLSQFIKSITNNNSNVKDSPTNNPHLLFILRFSLLYCKLSNLPTSYLDNFFPPYWSSLLQ